ncbi:MAG: hypothetical protein GWN99_19905 [Gemmatimonadetes bacterium]|uniref:Uncharacterized protein n=1 Tax=Candidatus Kutchimonas denitrificans TaxID=3056748 RepID=A0AAE5CD26_9BACT|nr:hypothetical protein [Gemmatimonadota bacterium]NIR76470.1 hypothetical protein [Candidatus Kutchimonas denitrificans]NIS03288.1 hypothetical protein [Gemmatimonadota bacterium]NIT69149.1 hypothetical protein [Gemmatimonadota bacterium]NIU54541.1 hypothetical protein [Gemmatimonadota bacterium]
MNKRWVLCPAVLVGLAACQGSTDLAVRAVSGDGEEMALANQVIRVLPYNRDSIFDVLARQAPEPEPQPPEDLLTLRDSVQAARERWTQAEAAWNDVRSQMQELSERMERMNRASSEYASLFRRFSELESQEARLNRMMEQNFEDFTAMQQQYRTRADSFNAVVLAWGDVAFEDYGEIVDSILEARDREELVDTADASGWAYLLVPGGQWWVHTRAELVFQELYWNVPYESPGGTDTLVLNEENAELRPIF